jgi:hypothetical protein
MITNGHPKAKEANVVSNFSELAHDAVELGELQVQLLAIDAATAWQRMRTGLIFAIVTTCLLLGSIPIILLVVAEALVEFANWSRTAALGLAGGIGMVLVVIVAALAWHRLNTMFAAFERSRAEFSQNVTWIKSNLKQPTGRPRRRSEVAMPH